MRLDISGFFRDIGNFFQSGSVLGIDIGTSSIKAVEVGKQGGVLALQNYAILETKNYLDQPNQAIQTSSLKISESDGAYLLENLLKEMKPKASIAMMSLPSFASFITVIDMPLLSKIETDRAVAFQAKQYIPVDISEVYIEWLRAEEFQDERGNKNQRLILMGTPKDLVAKYKEICRSAKVKIISLELESLALTRALGGRDDSPTMIVDVGAQATNILVTEGGVLKYNGETDYGGIHLSNALARGLGVSVFRAEELKRRRGLMGSGGEIELSTSMVSFLDVIIQEVRHVSASYERRYSKKIEKIVISGGGGNMLGIDKYFEAQIKIPVVSPAVLGGLSYPPEIGVIKDNLTRNLAVAIGLAKKYFSN